ERVQPDGRRGRLARAQRKIRTAFLLSRRQAGSRSGTGHGGESRGAKSLQSVNRVTDHPITKGLPKEWMHVGDELYANLRGPGENMTILSTAWSDPANHGTGRDEPMLMVITYGKGRVFHTAMGHDLAALNCAGFITTYQRGTEWAATGKVTQKASS